ncbi:BlaI/MecI/CopY family transcriptional regulator [Parahaliea mediterranea]|uniref:BlaI/MecI/CopY family transcriptional regulator n=1 Tax=Parahaliea mediterranea TaxID=651086 RepID=UPI000E2EE15F|nr:BlaI/MecI/CopY family transcriptional regulator [Parahaliea mediterranea]
MVELTKAELAVLQVLWKQAPLTVREVHDQLDNGWAYNTTKTVMDRMARKSLLERSRLHGVLIYTPGLSRAQGMVSWVRFIAQQVLEMDDRKVVNMFADSDLYTEQELRELQQLLDKAEKPEPPD